jgi:hypothetical protein
VAERSASLLNAAKTTGKKALSVSENPNLASDSDTEKETADPILGLVTNLTSEVCSKDGTNLGISIESTVLKLHFRKPGPTGETVCSYSDLAKLVEQSVRKDVFSNIILAERNGNVLYQTASGDTRFTNIDFLFSPAAEPSTKSLLGDTPAAKPAPPSTAGQNAPTSSTHLVRSIGDHQFAVFVQPIQLTLREGKGGGASGDWLLVGLSNANTPWQSSGPQGLLFVLPLVMLLVALSWTLPRPWLMSPAEPLRQRQLGITALCSGGMLLVLTVLGLYFFIRSFADVRTDGRLTLLAEEIGFNVKHELTLALKQLAILDSRAVDEIIFPRGVDSDVGLFKSLTPDQVTTNFQYADWISARGNKKIRWTSGEYMARHVNVKDRAYFQDVRQDHMVRGLPLAGTARTSPFAIEKVLSRTTGEMATMLAAPSEMRYQGTPVLSMALTLTALENPVLPAEFEFAVIASTGKVLYHSDPSRALVEDLFAECSDIPELVQVVERRAVASFTSNYSGAAHRMLVTPLPGLEEVPWTLVVFRKLEPIRVIRAQAMFGAVALFGCYAVAVLAIAVCVLYPFARWRQRFQAKLLLEAAWWSPRESCYPVLAAFGTCLMLIFWRSLDGARGSEIFYSSIATGAAFLIFSALGLGVPARRPLHRFSLAWLAGASFFLAGFAWILDDWWMAGLAPISLALVRYGQYRIDAPRGSLRQRTPASWVVWAAELALCLVILPTFGLGQLSYEYEAGLYARELQWELQDAHAQREDQLARDIRLLPGVEKCDLISHKLLSGLGTGPATESGCAPTYFYGSAGYNTRIVAFESNPGGPQLVGSSSCPAVWKEKTQPLSTDRDRKCGKEQLLLKAGDLPRIRTLFDETQSAWSRALSKLPVLVMAMVELPFDARQEGLDMRRDELQPGGAPPPWEWRVERGPAEHHLWLARWSEAEETYQLVARSTLPAFVPWNVFASNLWEVSENGLPTPRAGSLPTLWMGFQFWMGMFAIVGLFLWWGRAFRHRVRLDDLQVPASTSLYQPATVWQGRFLVHIPPGYPAAPLLGYWANHTRIDLASIDLSNPITLPEGAILINNLQSCLAIASQRRVCLDLIEGAIRTPNRCVVVTTSIEPLSYLQSGGAGAAGEPADEAELSRWKRITHSLDSRRAAAPEGTAPPEHDAVWMSCSVHEKAILTYLDRHKLVAPTAAPVAARLLGRGLLRRRPDGRIEFASPQFQRFVSALQEAPDEVLLASQSASKGISPWAIGIVLLGVVLFFAQEELTGRLLGFLAAVAGGLETLRKHLATISGSSSSSGSAKG